MSGVKLFVSDKYLDAFAQLPRSIQRKALEFQKKFREDSKQASIHLEPISTFKDSTLRSARIDQTYRAILKSFDNGNIFYLMYADHHDKAYQWAENKVFEWNQNTQVMQVFTNPEITQPPVFEKEDKEEKSGLFKDHNDDELIRLGLPDVLMPLIRNVEDLNDLDKIQKFLPEDIFENLFYLADGANISTLIIEIEEGKIQEENLEKQAESLNNQRNFIELTNDDIFNEVLEGGLVKWKYYLHPSQRKLVNKDFSGSIKVTGGAGTGKTVAAIHRLKYLVENSKPGAKILFTTFTRALTGNLVESAKMLNVDLSHVTIKNIDALAFDMAKDFHLISSNGKILDYDEKQAAKLWEDLLRDNLIPYDIDFLEKEYCDVILNNNVSTLNEYIKTYRTGRGKPIARRQKKELWDYFKMFIEYKSRDNYYYKAELYNILSDYLKENNITPFEHCIVDELQDFSNAELRLLRAFVEEKSNDLFMVGDPLQKIYDRKINFTRGARINIRGKKSQRLRINYRTTEEIKRLALSIIKNFNYDNFDGEEEEKAGYVSLFHGIKPKYRLFKTKDEEINALIEKIKSLRQQGYSLTELAITSRTRNGYKDFRSGLHNADIPYCEFQGGSKIGDIEGIPLLTFHNIKGLEFKQVFLVDVNERNCPLIPQSFEYYSEEEKENHLKSERSLLYVAISRAIQNVEISGIGSKSEMINI
jgi:hypothetical protein